MQENEFKFRKQGHYLNFWTFYSISFGVSFILFDIKSKQKTNSFKNV